MEEITPLNNGMIYLPYFTDMYIDGHEIHIENVEKYF